MSVLFATCFANITWQSGLAVGFGLLSVFCAALSLRNWLRISKRTAPVMPIAPPEPKPKPRTESSDNEQRIHQRISGHSQQVFLMSEDSKTFIAMGSICDKSLGGVGIDVPINILIGTHLRLTWKEAGTDTPGLLVEVRSSRMKGDQWRLGCQFLENTQWDIMQWMGPHHPQI